MTQVKFITIDRMLRNTNLYENRMFTNKVNQSIIWGERKGESSANKKFNSSKSLKEALEGRAMKDQKELV